MRCYTIEICCDTCPFSPTCEEEQDFYRQIGLAVEFEYGDDDVDA